MLLEGEDLTVENGQVMVRTVAGPEAGRACSGAGWMPAWADPLELNETSQHRHAGPDVGALRAGQRHAWSTRWASGVLETRALLAFLPRIAEALTGKPLQLPNIATWWCGQEAERDACPRQCRRAC